MRANTDFISNNQIIQNVMTLFQFPGFSLGSQETLTQIFTTGKTKISDYQISTTRK